MLEYNSSMLFTRIGNCEILFDHVIFIFDWTKSFIPIFHYIYLNGVESVWLKGEAVHLYLNNI